MTWRWGRGRRRRPVRRHDDAAFLELIALTTGLWVEEKEEVLGLDSIQPGDSAYAMWGCTVLPARSTASTRARRQAAGGLLIRLPNGLQEKI